MTFEEWWKDHLPNDDFDESRFKEEYRKCWEAAYQQGVTEGYLECQEYME